MKTSQRATKKPLVVVLVAIIIITLITVGMIVLNQTNGIKSGRQQFYVVSGGIGGRCSHYLANSKGERQSTCVDSKLATWPLPRIDTDPTQELGAGTTSAAAVRAVRVDANVTVTTEQRSIPLPKPDYKKTRVIYIDDVLSAEVVTLP